MKFCNRIDYCVFDNARIISSLCTYTTRRRLLSLFTFHLSNAVCASILCVKIIYQCERTHFLQSKAVDIALRLPPLFLMDQVIILMRNQFHAIKCLFYICHYSTSYVISILTFGIM